MSPSANGLPRGNLRARDSATCHQCIRVPAIAAFALLIALDLLCATASAHTKTHPSPKRPHHQIQPPPALFIKCAAVSGGWPCWPDPGMMRLERPGWRFDAPVDPPPLAPSR